MTPFIRTKHIVTPKHASRYMILKDRLAGLILAAIDGTVTDSEKREFTVAQSSLSIKTYYKAQDEGVPSENLDSYIGKAKEEAGLTDFHPTHWPLHLGAALIGLGVTFFLGLAIIKAAIG